MRMYFLVCWRQFKHVIPWLLLGVVPTAFLAPLFVEDRSVFVAQSEGTISAPSDALGLVRAAQMLAPLVNPFERQRFTAFPDGEQFWQIQNVSQTIQLFFVWFSGKLIDPFAAANLFILLGWICTGISVFLLAKYLGIRGNIALLSALAAEVSFGMITAASSYPSMAWICLPVFSILAIQIWLSTGKAKSLNLAVFLTLACSLMDIYLYVLALVSFIILMLLESRRNYNYLRHMSVKGRTFAIVSICGSFMPLGAIYLLGFLASHSPGTRAIQPPSLVDVDSFGLLTSDWYMPNGNAILGSLLQVPSHSGSAFLGFSVFVLAAIGVVGSFRHFGGRRWIGLVVLTLALISSSLKLTVETPVLDLPNISQWLRFLAPGTLHLNRAAVLAACLICIFAAVGLQWCLSRFRNRKVNALVLILAGVLISIEILPARSLIYRANSNTYGALQQQLDLDKGTGILFAPNDFQGRGWMQQTYLGLPMYNSLYGDSRYLDLQERFREPRQLACQLKSSGISHVVSMLDYGQGQDSIQTRFRQPYFVMETIQNVPLYEYSAGRATGAKLALYSVNCI